MLVDHHLPVPGLQHHRVVVKGRDPALQLEAVGDNHRDRPALPAGHSQDDLLDMIGLFHLYFPFLSVLPSVPLVLDYGREGGGIMSENSLMEIKQIKEVESEDDANAYLAMGWKLISTYTYLPYRDEYGNLRQVYVLGWPSDLEELNYLQDEKGCDF